MPSEVSVTTDPLIVYGMVGLLLGALVLALLFSRPRRGLGAVKQSDVPERLPTDEPWMPTGDLFGRDPAPLAAPPTVVTSPPAATPPGQSAGGPRSVVHRRRRPNRPAAALGAALAPRRAAPRRAARLRGSCATGETPMDLLDRLDAMIDERHLLKHPFYTRWNDGSLPLDALQEYARQYYAFEAAFPRQLSAIHSRTDDPAVRQQLLDNLWDEEHGRDNHAELWLRFAEGIGVERDDVRSAERNEATQALVDLYTDLARRVSVPAAVAALYAYERQVPQVAGSKIDGLQRHYGVDDARTTAFFTVHGVLDIEHSAAERNMLVTLTDGADPGPIEDATKRALEAWWNFLSAVDQPAPVAN